MVLLTGERSDQANVQDDGSNDTIETQPPTATTSSASSTKQPAIKTLKPRFRRCGKRQSASNTVDDSQLFNSWLSSEIEKNTAKKELFKTQIEKITAQKELIELMKKKTRIEIGQLENETFSDSLVFDAED